MAVDLPNGSHAPRDGYALDYAQDEEDLLYDEHVPIHPVPSMQEAFEESIQEAAEGVEDVPQLDDAVNAEERRRELLDRDHYDASWSSRWKQRPSARCHPIIKLMSQIIFGLHLLQQRQAKSEAEVVKILQIHVDEIDSFLEKTTDDFDIAVKDIEERTHLLKLPMTHVEVFDQMLDDKKFRMQLIEGNDKIESIIERTAKAMNAGLHDIQKGVDATQQLADYLDSVQDRWPQETSDQSAIFIAMRGNDEGWQACLHDLQARGQQLGIALVQLGNVVADMSTLASAASRRNRVATAGPAYPLSDLPDQRPPSRPSLHSRKLSKETINKPLPQVPDAIEATNHATAPPSNKDQHSKEGGFASRAKRVGAPVAAQAKDLASFLKDWSNPRRSRILTQPQGLRSLPSQSFKDSSKKKGAAKDGEDQQPYSFEAQRKQRRKNKDMYVDNDVEPRSMDHSFEPQMQPEQEEVPDNTYAPASETSQSQPQINVAKTAPPASEGPSPKRLPVNTGTTENQAQTPTSSENYRFQYPSPTLRQDTQVKPEKQSKRTKHAGHGDQVHDWGLPSLNHTSRPSPADLVDVATTAPKLETISIPRPQAPQQEDVPYAESKTNRPPEDAPVGGNSVSTNTDYQEDYHSPQRSASASHKDIISPLRINTNIAPKIPPPSVVPIQTSAPHGSASNTIGYTFLDDTPSTKSPGRTKAVAPPMDKIAPFATSPTSLPPFLQAPPRKLNHAIPPRPDSAYAPEVITVNASSPTTVKRHIPFDPSIVIQGPNALTAIAHRQDKRDSKTKQQVYSGPLLIPEIDSDPNQPVIPSQPSSELPDQISAINPAKASHASHRLSADQETLEQEIVEQEIVEQETLEKDPLEQDTSTQGLAARKEDQKEADDQNSPARDSVAQEHFEQAHAEHGYSKQEHLAQDHTEPPKLGEQPSFQQELLPHQRPQQTPFQQQADQEELVEPKRAIQESVEHQYVGQHLAQQDPSEPTESVVARTASRESQTDISDTAYAQAFALSSIQPSYITSTSPGFQTFVRDVTSSLDTPQPPETPGIEPDAMPTFTHRAPPPPPRLPYDNIRTMDTAGRSSPETRPQTKASQGYQNPLADFSGYMPPINHTESPRNDSTYAFTPINGPVEDTMVEARIPPRAPSRLGLFPDLTLVTTPGPSRVASFDHHRLDHHDPIPRSRSPSIMMKVAKPGKGKKIGRIFKRKNKNTYAYVSVSPQ